MIVSILQLPTAILPGEVAMESSTAAGKIIIDQTSQEVLPVGRMLFRRYTGHYDGIPYAGVIGEVFLSQDGFIFINKLDGDFGFFFKREDTVLVHMEGNLQLHIMRRGIFIIHDVLAA